MKFFLNSILFGNDFEFNFVLCFELCFVKLMLHPNFIFYQGISLAKLSNKKLSNYLLLQAINLLLLLPEYF